MDDDILILDNVSKKFARNLKESMKHGLQDIGRELKGLPRTDYLRASEFWALDGISFSLKKGQSLGVLGTNGAGKTTTMKLISGLIKPDKGSIRTVGKVGALISLGAGFNPVLTGRENLFINAAVFGATYKETQRKFDEIVEFAEISDAIDAPVRTYSSGMAVRLGFSIATHIMQPDILLLDEVLAVGDENFRVKCFQKISELKKNGSAIVLISHNIANIFNFTDYCVHIEKGKQIGFGTTDEMARSYERYITRQDANDFTDKSADPSNIRNLRVFNFSNPGQEQIETGDTLGVSFNYSSADMETKSNVDIYIRGEGLGDRTLRINVGKNNLELSPHDKEHVVVLKNLCLAPGTYSLKVFTYGSNKTIYGISKVHTLVISSSRSLLGSPFFQAASVFRDDTKLENTP